MFSIDRWNEIFQALNKNKLRTILTMFSVFWGIFMLIILQGFGNGLHNAATENFSGRAVNAISFYPGQTSLPYKGYKPGRTYNFTTEDYEYISNNVEGFDKISTSFNIWGRNKITYKKKALSFRTESVRPDFKVIRNLNILEGRFINENDLKNKAKVAVIGKDVQKELFQKSEPLGEYFKFGNAMFRVVGVYEHQWNSRSIYFPVTTARSIYNGGKQVHNIQLTSNYGKEVEAKIKKYIASKHKFDPKDNQALHVWNTAEDFKRFSQTFFAIKLFVLIIGIFTIISGIVGISNIMLIVVKERTKEIGIRKAIGASPISVVGLVLQEAITITGIAGYLGLVFGIGILELVQKVMPPTQFLSNPQIDFGLAVYATLFLIIAGAIAGFVPARKASKIRPIVALMEE
jgi:putative ABC transport system permease protein